MTTLINMKIDYTVEVKTYDLLSEKCQKNGTNHNIKLEMILSFVESVILYSAKQNFILLFLPKFKLHGRGFGTT